MSLSTSQESFAPPDVHAPSVHSAASHSRRYPMDVVPSRSLGQFRLGTPLHELIAQLQSSRPDVCVGAVLGRRGMVTQLVIENYALVLTFHPRTLLLESIRASNLSILELTHQEGPLCGRGATPTFVRLYELLGPTFAGSMNHETGEYVLSYPGLDVIFRIPVHHRRLFVDGSHPITLPDGTTPVALEIQVREEKAGIATVPPSLFVPPWSTARIVWGKGVHFVPWGDDPNIQSAKSALVSFGMCVQDVLSLLGPPGTWMQKDDSRLRIHSSVDAKSQQQGRHVPLFSLGYPAHGIDLLFSSADGLLEKMCLFTGVQHHDAFLQYHRSWFEMAVTPRNVLEWLGGSAAPSRSSSGSVKGGEDTSLMLTPETRWSAVAEFTKSYGELPRPLLAAAATGALNVSAMSGIIFTTVQQTDDIAMITLVKPSPMGLARTADHQSNGAAVTISLTPSVSAPTPTSKRPSPYTGPQSDELPEAPEHLKLDGPVPVRPHVAQAASADFEDIDADEYMVQPPPKNTTYDDEEEVEPLADPALSQTRFVTPREPAPQPPPPPRHVDCEDQDSGLNFGGADFPGFGGFTAQPKPNAWSQRLNTNSSSSGNQNNLPTPKSAEKTMPGFEAAPIIAHPIDKFFTLGAAIAEPVAEEEFNAMIESRNKPTAAEFESSDSGNGGEGGHADISLTVSPIVGASAMPPPPPHPFSTPPLTSSSNQPHTRDDTSAPPESPEMHDANSAEDTPPLKGHSPDADDDATPPVTPGGGFKLLGANIALKPSKKKGGKGKGKGR